MTIAEQKMLRIEHANPEHGRQVVIDWTLGTTCNFACAYCPPALHDGRAKWQPVERVLLLCDDMKAHYGDHLGRQVWLQFTGGEPTLHPQIRTILEAAAGHGFRASLISNGSRTLRFWEGTRAHLDRVILTYHDAFVDHDHFVTVAAFLSETMPVHVNVTVHPDRFDAILDKADDVAQKVSKATLTVKPLRVGFGDVLYDYTPDQLARLGSRDALGGFDEYFGPRGKMRVDYEDGAHTLRDASEFLTRGENTWLGWRCDAGLESLRVTATGDVYRSVCSSGGRLGNLYDTVTLPRTALRCDKVRCSCIGDILISKSRLA